MNPVPLARRLALAAAGAVALATGLSGTAVAQPATKTLRVVMHSDLKILDPVWTTAYIVRNHGFMIYDQLFALDANLEPRPQMVESWTASPDNLVWTFTLREGLKFHDGQPVTAEDCVASLKRWGAADTVGRRMMTFVSTMVPVDAKTFRIELKEPFGPMLKALAKSSSVPPLIMPKRVADTPYTQQISDMTGSGPFIFKRDEGKPGDKVGYVRNPDYQPRAEPPSGLAGGKVVKLDRVEWIAMPDSQTAINALANGEIDMIEQPRHDLLPVLEKEKDIAITLPDKFGAINILRFNWLHAPFNDVRVRRAAMMALNREDFLKAQIGDPRYYKVCGALFGCGTPLETTVGNEGLFETRFEEARKLLKEAGYDGSPIVLLHSTDLAVLANLAPVAKALLEKGGFKVDMRSMDWQSLVSRRSKKDPPAQGGWNIAMTAAATVLLLDPVNNHYTEATGEKAAFGWPTDAETEALRARFLRETDPARQKEIAAAVQKRVLDQGIVANLGQYLQPTAFRRSVTGLVESPVPVFWNVEKR